MDEDKAVKQTFERLIEDGSCKVGSMEEISEEVREMFAEWEAPND